MGARDKAFSALNIGQIGPIKRLVTKYLTPHHTGGIAWPNILSALSAQATQMKITPLTFSKMASRRVENRIQGNGAEVRSNVLLKTLEF